MPGAGRDAFDPASGLVKSVATARPATYAILAIAGVVGGLGTGRPELVAIGAGPALLLVVGALLFSDPEVTVTTSISRARAIENEVLNLHIDLVAENQTPRLEVQIKLPTGLDLMRVVDPEHGKAYSVVNGVVALALRAGERRRLRAEVRCRRWGVYRTGTVVLTATDRLRLSRRRFSTECPLGLKVFPPDAALRELVDPKATRPELGELLSKTAGDGIEFAELRSFSPGDDARRINWRASARRGNVWVNDRHPEHNSELVLVVDALAGKGRVDRGVLDAAVRAAAAVSASHLSRRDRVGLLLLGGRLIWVRPQLFDLQRQRIFDALADSALLDVHPAGRVSVPFRLLPPHATLLAVSPLLAEQAIAALVELSGRGHDLAVIEVALPRAYGAEGPEEAIALRLWELQRDRMRRAFRSRGVAVATWDPGDPFEIAMGEVTRFRKATARAGI